VRVGLAVGLLAALATPLLAQDTEQVPPTPGFLGISMEPSPIPDSDPPAAVIRVTAVVPASAASAAGLEVGDEILAVGGESVQAAPDQVLARFGERIKGLGAGAKLRLTLRRRAVMVRTYVDEKALGPEQDASGPGAVRRILPDLADLLDEHAERLVGIRARSFERERVLEVVLGRRPGTTDEPLPDNATLWPGLDAQPHDAVGSLAERVIARASFGDQAAATTYHEILERFERDESIEDPFRLKTVRYLRRAPLRLSLATRTVALSLRRTFLAPRESEPETSGLRALLNTARAHLSAAAPTDPEAAPQAPPRRAPPEAHGAYLLSCVELAERRVARALAALSDDEQRFLAETLPGLADKFIENIYLHTDEDTERWGRHARAIALLAKVDRGAMLSALAALIPVANPTYLVQLREDLKAAEDGGVKTTVGGVRQSVLWFGGSVVIGGSANNEYRREGLKVVVDLGGDDRYHVPVGSGSPGIPAALCIDLGGDDRYQSTVRFAQGTGFLGVGLLLDAAGADHYTSNRPFAQGAALAGAGLLVDLGGDDVYRGTAYAQGAALAQGLAALVDLSGDDVVTAGIYSQAFAGPGTFACLLARGGDDRYSALGMVACGYGDPGTYRAMSQGSSVGFRHQASGGIAVLLDQGGADHYEAGNFSQGGGYFFGWGALVDLGGGPDRYEGSRYSQGFAAHSALGSLWDDGGDDVYRGWVGAQASAAWDLSATSFLDEAGDDVYEPGPGFSLGASAHNGFALFVDAGGRDRYRVGPGRAGPNDYHGGPSLSVFVDAGGEADVYAGGGLSDGRAATRANVGIVLDLEGSLEDTDDATLDALLTPRTMPAPEAPEAPEKE
jgi:hypothetical protein